MTPFGLTLLSHELLCFCVYVSSPLPGVIMLVRRRRWRRRKKKEEEWKEAPTALLSYIQTWWPDVKLKLCGDWELRGRGRRDFFFGGCKHYFSRSVPRSVWKMTFTERIYKKHQKIFTKRDLQEASEWKSDIRKRHDTTTVDLLYQPGIFSLLTINHRMRFTLLHNKVIVFLFFFAPVAVFSKTKHPLLYHHTAYHHFLHYHAGFYIFWFCCHKCNTSISNCWRCHTLLTFLYIFLWLFLSTELRLTSSKWVFYWFICWINLLFIKNENKIYSRCICIYSNWLKCCNHRLYEREKWKQLLINFLFVVSFVLNVYALFQYSYYIEFGIYYVFFLRYASFFCSCTSAAEWD